MTDLEFLYLVTAAFYLWECTHWLPNSVVPYVSWFGKLFRASTPFFVVNSRDAGLVLSPVMPIWGTLFVASEQPIAVSPIGVANHAGKFVPFADQPRFVARRNRLLAKGQYLAKMPSSSFGGQLAQELNRMVSLPADQRESEIRRALSDSLNSAALAERVEDFKKSARLSSLMASMLFLFVFLLAPAAIWRSGLVVTWPWLVGGLVSLCVLNASVFFRAHKRLHPELDDERFTHFLMVLLFPPAGMRTRDILSRPLLERFHPLAVARELSPPQSFEEMACRVLRQLRYPLAPLPGMAPESREVWSWFNCALRSHVEQFVSSNGLQPDRCAAAPERSDTVCRSYCPRCHAQFVLSDGTCSDCGISLLKFS